MKSPARLLLLLSAGLALSWWLLWQRGPQPLVVYCAHDSVYSEKILRRFEQQTGIPLSIRFDTEATKSLGLVELLIAEKDAPRCDLFWNNELLGTVDLASRGVLEAYRGPGYARIPAKFRDPDALWTGFAARLRVCIFNTRSIDSSYRTYRSNRAYSSDLSDPSPQPPQPPQNPQNPQNQNRNWAIAKPLYGTTLTHYTVLWKILGPEKLAEWHHKSRTAGLHELSGNAAVKDAVAQGACDAGFTDSDDFFEAKDAGQPVAMRPVRLSGGETICIPNTVAIIRGTRRQDAARQLADFLLSAETELALAHSSSRQIPLGPVAEGSLPEEVRQLQTWAQSAYPLTGLAEAHARCLEWLKGEYLR